MKQQQIIFYDQFSKLIASYVLSVASNEVSPKEFFTRIEPILEKLKPTLQACLDEINDVLNPAEEIVQDFPDYNLIVDKGSLKAWEHKTDTSKPLVTTNPGALACYVADNLPKSMDLHMKILTNGLLRPCKLK